MLVGYKLIEILIDPLHLLPVLSPQDSGLRHFIPQIAGGFLMIMEG